MSGFVNTGTESTQVNGAGISSLTINLSPAVLGDTVFIVPAWGSSVIGTANTGDITSISDTQGNSWTRIGSTFYTNATTGGHWGLAVFFSNITHGGNTTVTVNISNGPYSRIWLTSVGYSNVFSPFFDAVSASAIGTGTVVTANGVTPTTPHTGLLFIGTQGFTQSTMPAPNAAWTQRFSGVGGPFVQELPFVGQGYSVGTNAGFYSGFNAAPFGFQGTMTASEDWGAVVISVPVNAYEALAQGDTTESSGGSFQQFKENFFQADIFLGGYTGLAWLKNVYMLPRDYWDKALSTPYSGQLFPVGPGEGGPGQIYPY